MANVTCPFCGESFAPFVHMAVAEHPPNIDCPLFGRTLKIEEWNMRPPKKEQPTKDVSQSEVEWLRCIVKTLVETRAPSYPVTYDKSGTELNLNQDMDIK